MLVGCANYRVAVGLLVGQGWSEGDLPCLYGSSNLTRP